MKDGTAMLAVSVSLGALLLVGAGVGGYLLLKPHAAPPGLPATTPTSTAPAAGVSTLPIGNGVVAPIGPNAADIYAAQEAERRRQEEWRRADKVRELDQTLAECQNEIKRLTDQLNVIDSGAMPPDIVADAVRQRQQWCWSQKPAWRLDWRCDIYQDLVGDGGRWQKLADDAFAARKVEQKRPILTRLSELNTKQQNLIANLAQLGVTKQPFTVRTT